MAEDGKIDIVIGKGLSILGHAELFEPVRNLLHGGHRDPSGPNRVFHHGNREFTPISPQYHTSQYRVRARSQQQVGAARAADLGGRWQRQRRGSAAVKLVYYDDQTNPATVPALYQKLL